MPSDPVRIQQSQSDWSQGINSNVVTTIESPQSPNGLKRTQAAWLTNATVRGGGIMPRTGWNYLCTLGDGSAKWQFGSLYTPDFADPYLIYQMGGRIYQCRVDTNNAITDLSAAFGLTNPTGPDRAFFCQGEQFLIIQAGDFGTVANPTKPLFWDGAHLKRSIGITTTSPANAPNINQIPAATCMQYYMGRLWYAQGRTFSAGDIVAGPSGTAAYAYRDAILNVTENPLCFGGDGFTVPTNAGNIRALNFTANLDTQLGQGPLFIFTRKQIYQLIVPVTRTDWIAATNSNQPLMTVAQIVNGSVNDTCVTPVNGDLFYQSLDLSIRSLISAIRYYNQWGNTPISVNENRLLQLGDRSLLHMASGIEFDNRLLQTALPVQTAQGVVHKALVPLDFNIISTLEEKLPPAWEGGYEGLNVLQLFTGDFGGRQRAFAAVVSSLDSSIQLWEMTNFAQFDNNKFGESRITWIVETPSYTFGDENQFKQLENAEFWFDRIYGDVIFKLQYRQDGNPCWIDWHEWQVCVARNSNDAGNPSYPFTQYCESDQKPMVMPKAPGFGCSPTNSRPTNLGYQFQLRLTIKGFARLRSIRVFALPKERQHYDGLVCNPYTRNVAQPLADQSPESSITGDALGDPVTGTVFGDSSGNVLGIPA